MDADGCNLRTYDAAMSDEKPTLAEGQTVAEEEAVVSLRHTDVRGERYAPLGEIGRGGMGEISLCLDRRIGRRVALKRSRPGTNLERFVREACVQGQLEHPTIVPLYDMIVSASGETSFTMKRVRGRTLKDVLASLAKGDAATSERFTQRKLLTDFGSVCLGVAFAHSRGVVHRDLKPENLMLGDYGEVYVLDWGVAKIRETPALPEEPVELPMHADATAAGSMIGTPGYMSPEQCMGELDEIDDRSDVYSLGAILFEILALQRLHKGKTVEALVESTLRGADAHADARAPGRNVPPELDAICVRATAQRREDRFATARDLHDAIERYLNHDRDTELRRTLAARHAEVAKATSDRKVALSEAGRALALDPTNDDAQRVLLRLLTEPPERVPEEAQRELDASWDEQRRKSSSYGVYTIPLFAMFAPVMIAMGVESWATFAVFFGGFALFFVGCAVITRMERPGNRAPIALALICTVVNAASSMLFGPLVVTPTFAMLSTVTLVTQVERHRWFVLLLGFVPIIAPLVATHFGLAPPSYSFSDGVMHVLPVMVHLRPFWSLVLLVTMNLTCLVAATVLAAQLRGNLTVTERKLVVQAWQLRQLLP